MKIRTVSETNCAENHWKKYKRKKMQKFSTWSYLINEIKNIPLPCHILLEREGRILDDDNFPPSLKYIRDQIADMLIPGLAPGRADNDPRITWHYRQVKAKDKDYGVTVTFFVD